MELGGAPFWWGGDRRSAARGEGQRLQALTSPTAGQSPAPSGHTEPAGTRPRTLYGAPCGTGGEKMLSTTGNERN